MPMVSYAQNGEDVVLRRVFVDQENGFYIDVGACHPADDSITLHFYERGWRGINVEPDAELHAALTQSRPHDVNLCTAIGRERRRVAFHPTGTRGHGTLSPDIASGRTEGRSPVRVPQMPLSDVIDCYGPDGGQIDFLKVDVEGWEVEVIASADWNRHRPRVVLVEAVNGTGEATHAAWEPSLLAAGYRFAMFDGLNRFYCREEDADRLLPRLMAPANVLDNWVRSSEMQSREAVARYQAEIAAAAQHAAEQARVHEAEIAATAQHAREQKRLDEEVITAARDQAAAAEARSDALGADLEEARAAEAAATPTAEQLRAELSATKEHCDVLAVEVTRSRAEAAAALRREEAAEAQMSDLEMKVGVSAEQIARLSNAHAEAVSWVAAMRASTSWRLTAPIRLLGELVHERRHGK